MSETKEKPQEILTEEQLDQLANSLDSVRMERVETYMKEVNVPNMQQRYTFVLDYYDNRKLHPLKIDHKVADDD